MIGIARFLFAGVFVTSVASGTIVHVKKMKAFDVGNCVVDQLDTETEADFVVYLYCKKAKGKTPLWKTQILSGRYTEDRENLPLQWVYILTGRLEKGAIVVEDNRHQIYRVDPKTGKLISPDKPVFYPAKKLGRWPSPPSDG